MKRSVFIPIPKKGDAKECSNYHTVRLISHDSKVTLKIPQTTLPTGRELRTSKLQAGFRKGEESRWQNRTCTHLKEHQSHN